MNPFWRSRPLDPNELELIGALGEAHNASTFRSNPSTIALRCAAQGSGDLFQSIVAALSALGGRHGPIKETYDWLESSYAAKEIVQEYIQTGQKLEGWGTSFTKGQLDTEWIKVNNLLELNFGQTYQRMDAYTKEFHNAGKMIFPNPSAFTAVTAMAIEMPKRLAPYLLLIGRVSAWGEIFFNETKD
jgi:citrate synthase